MLRHWERPIFSAFTAVASDSSFYLRRKTFFCFFVYVGVMAAWELKLADYSVESFDDVTILDFRQVFADREFEPGATQVEVRHEERERFSLVVIAAIGIAERLEWSKISVCGLSPGSGGYGRQSNFYDIGTRQHLLLLVKH